MNGSRGRSRWLLLAALLVAALILHVLRLALIPFVLAAGLTYIAAPPVTWAEQRFHLPRIAVVAIFYALALGLAVGLGLSFGPLLLAGTKNVINEIPRLVPSLISELLGAEEIMIMGRTITAQAIAENILETAKTRLATPEGVVGLGRPAAGLFFGTLLTLVVLFYFLASRDLLARIVFRFAPRGEHWRIRKFVQDFHSFVGRYLRGILLVILTSGGSAYLGLEFVFDLPYAAPLAIATGFLEILPVLGPILSITLACFTAMLTGGFWLVFQVGIFYGAVRILLDNIMSPIVFGWAAVIHPATVLFAFLAGGTLFGTLGLLLAIPLTATVRMALENWDDYFGG